ncbi:hypothetical protein HWV62_26851 [Athelia sp. TMB]|nr:hypothetical protein HWV62_26851 [Athelia sp. TMB]
MSCLPVLDQQNVRMWEEEHGKRKVLAGEGIMRFAFFAGYLDVDSITASGSATVMTVDLVPLHVASPGSFVSRPITPAPFLAMHPLHALKPNPAALLSLLAALVVASDNPRYVCLVAKRNARLAEALGISTDASREKNVTYNDEVTLFARANAKFVGLVEKTFADFVTSAKKQQVLPHMPPDRQWMSRWWIKNHIAVAASSGPSLGKLADLRGGLTSSSASRPPSNNPSRASTPSVGASRGWTSVVSKPVPAPSNPVPTPSVQRTSWRPSAPRPQVSTPPPVVPVPPPAINLEDVPDSWEDDV